MRKVFAIARLALAAAVRSRVVATLLVLLFVTLCVLPITIRGDGTLQGHVRILLTYTLGATFVLLSLATLWAGCASISQEIQERQAHLLFTKPVSRVQLWAGKWLGLVVLNGLLLALSAGATYAMLRWTTRAGALNPEEQVLLRRDLLVARLEVTPHRDDLREAVERELDTALQAGHLPQDVSPAEAMEQIESVLLRQRFTVEPGRTGTWRFRLPKLAADDRENLLSFRFTASRPGPQSIHGTWSAGPPDRPALVEIEGDYLSGQRMNIPLPSHIAGQGLELVLSFANRDEEALSAFFNPRDGLRLLVYRGSFEGNLLRATLTLFCRLAFFAAIGVTAGALLSTPTALFAACAAALLLQSTGYIEDMAHRKIIFETHTHVHDGHEHEPGPADMFFSRLFKTVNACVQPLRDPPVLDRLGTGLVVTWRDVARTLVFKVVLYTTLLATLASALLRRREIGLPA